MGFKIDTLTNLILRELFSAFDKNPLGIFKCEHMKKLDDFIQMGILVKAYWVSYFQGFVIEILTSLSLKII